MGRCCLIYSVNHQHHYHRYHFIIRILVIIIIIIIIIVFSSSSMSLSSSRSWSANVIPHPPSTASKLAIIHPSSIASKLAIIHPLAIHNFFVSMHCNPSVTISTIAVSAGSLLLLVASKPPTVGDITRIGVADPVISLIL